MSITSKYMHDQNGIFYTHISKIIKVANPSVFSEINAVSWKIDFEDGSTLETFEVLETNDGEIEKKTYAYKYKRPSGFFFSYEMEDGGKSRYLFSIDTPLIEADLNKGIISGELKHVFKSKRFPLSENTTIRKEKDNKWELDNGKEVYIIRKEGGTLKTYESSIVEELWKPKYHVHVGVKKEKSSLIKEIPEQLIEHKGPHYKTLPIEINEIVGMIIVNFFLDDKNYKTCDTGYDKKYDLESVKQLVKKLKI